MMIKIQEDLKFIKNVILLFFAVCIRPNAEFRIIEFENFYNH